MRVASNKNFASSLVLASRKASQLTVIHSTFLLSQNRKKAILFNLDVCAEGLISCSSDTPAYSFT